jgi:hypothetical protein
MDIYDGADWTEMDVDDLKAAIESGHSIEEAAEFLCHVDSVDDVARKCEELGLRLKVPMRSFKMMPFFKVISAPCYNLSSAFE